jgi:GTPase Era involved in 16S rRNA processing
VKLKRNRYGHKGAALKKVGMDARVDLEKWKTNSY